MEKETNTTPQTNVLNPEKLNQFFTSQLNRIYCAKSHVLRRLPEIGNHAHFTDLKYAITETVTDVERQIERMDQIFLLLETKPGFEHCQGVTGIIDDAFSAIHREADDPELRDLSILFYLQNIEGIEMASFKMLKMAAPKLDKKEIRQLLRENFDEAHEDLALLQHITSTYFNV
jgi:ferritin-like metal-binding protein YciE